MVENKESRCPKEYLNYLISDDIQNVNQYFKSTHANNWSSSSFYFYTIGDQYDTRKLRNKVLNNFKSQLEIIKHDGSVPGPIRNYASLLIKESNYNVSDINKI